MDPTFITAQDWIEYRDLVSYLWLFPLLTFVFATCLLVGFGIIPSLVNSKELPAKAQRVRPLLYLTAAGALAGLVVVFFVARELARVIEETYPQWWI